VFGFGRAGRGSGDGWEKGKRKGGQGAFLFLDSSTGLRDWSDGLALQVCLLTNLFIIPAARASRSVANDNGAFPAGVWRAEFCH